MRYGHRQLLCILFLSILGVAATAQTDESDLRDEAVDAPSAAYRGITGKQRVRWSVKGTIGLESLGLGILTAGQATAQNDPHEYGPHWDGFGKRYGMRLTGVATEHAMEAGLGALWGEDPRYFRSDDGAYRERIKHVIVSTFAAYQADGHFGPTDARSQCREAISSPTRGVPTANLLRAMLGENGMGFCGTNGKQRVRGVLARRQEARVSPQAVTT